MYYNLPFSYDVRHVLFNRTDEDVPEEWDPEFPAYYAAAMGTFPKALDILMSTMPPSPLPALGAEYINPVMIELMLDGVAPEHREGCRDFVVESLCHTWRGAPQTAYGWFCEAYDRIHSKPMLTKGTHFSNLIQLKLACMFGLLKNICEYNRWSTQAEEKLAYLLNRLMSEEVV